MPPDRLEAFFGLLGRCLGDGGQFFAFDQHARNSGRPAVDGDFEESTLADGRTFKAVKVYHRPDALADLCSTRGFRVQIHTTERLWSLIGTRPATSDG